MHVAEIWRYPVKSLGGERLQVTELGPDGVFGDRLVQVRNGRGKVVTARTRPRLLGLHGTLGPDGGPIIEGRPWTASESLELVRSAAGADTRLVRAEPPDRFDVLPLLIATDGAIQSLGVDHRRLRPNIVIAGVSGLEERTWPGRQLRIGGAIITPVKVRQRCVMTTFDPDRLEQDVSVLRRIIKEFDGVMALDCAVLQGGPVAVGDPVIFLEGNSVGTREERGRGTQAAG
jgi:MOSC domain-containing protein